MLCVPCYMLYDLIIIGAGPAGLSAAIYATRKKIDVLVLAENIGGQATEAHLVENYLGIPGLLGVELVEKFKEHTAKFNIRIKEGVEIKRIEKISEKEFLIKTNSEDFNAKTLLIASGKKYRHLNIPGAKEFEKKGISYCATCDAPLFKDKIVAVIGAGDAGQDAAWQLTKYASKIYLLNKYASLRGQNLLMQEQIKAHKKIEILNESLPTEIKGEKFASSIVYEKSGEKKEIAVNGIFVEIGSVPISEFLNNMVELNEKEEIIIDENNATSQKGIFAAGDVTNIKYKQIIIAAGEGAKAALSAYDYIK